MIEELVALIGDLVTKAAGVLEGNKGSGNGIQGEGSIEQPILQNRCQERTGRA